MTITADTPATTAAESPSSPVAFALVMREVPMFAWHCKKVTCTAGEASECDVSGWDRAEYAAHMRTHGRTQLHPSQPKIRLRKGGPKYSPPAPRVLPFKTMRWTETASADGTCECGHKGSAHASDYSGTTWAGRTEDDGKGCAECECMTARYDVPRDVTITDCRGQFWCNGTRPGTVYAITYEAEGVTPRLVELGVKADGTVTPEWWEAAQSRREARTREATS